jgi:hypothetical protein
MAVTGYPKPEIFVNKEKHCVINFVLDQWRTQEFCSGWGSTNSVEDRGKRVQGSGGGSPLVKGFIQFAID